jgi:tetratricopeptide (TPR) repeat protein
MQKARIPREQDRVLGVLDVLGAADSSPTQEPHHTDTMAGPGLYHKHPQESDTLMFPRSFSQRSLFPILAAILCALVLPLLAGCSRAHKSPPGSASLTQNDALTSQSLDAGDQKTNESAARIAPRRIPTPKPTLELVESKNQGRTSGAAARIPSPLKGAVGTTEVLPPRSGADPAADAALADADPTSRDIQSALFTSPDKKSGKGKADTSSPDEEKKGQDALPDPDSLVQLDTFPYHYANARKLVEIQEYTRATEEFLKAAKLDPASMECLLDYGACLEKMGKKEDALAVYQAATERHPNEPRPLLRVGNLFLNGKTDDERAKAREAYQKALEFRPDYKYALYNLGILEKKEGHASEAIALFRKVLALDEYYADAHVNLGLLLLSDKEKRAEAMQHLKRYVELGGGDSAKVEELIKSLTRKPPAPVAVAPATKPAEKPVENAQTKPAVKKTAKKRGKR